MKAQRIERGASRRSSRSLDGTVDRHLEVLSRLMDSAFEVPGLRWRFGLDALAGLVPGVGDLASGLVAIYIIFLAAARYRLPRITLVRMGLNVAIDLVIGLVPLLGDVFDVWWKANERNMELIRRRSPAFDANARRGTGGDWVVVGLTIGAVLAAAVGIVFMIGYLLNNFTAWLGI